MVWYRQFFISNFPFIINILYTLLIVNHLVNFLITQTLHFQNNVENNFPMDCIIWVNKNIVLKIIKQKKTEFLFDFKCQRNRVSRFQDKIIIKTTTCHALVLVRKYFEKTREY